MHKFIVLLSVLLVALSIGCTAASPAPPASPMATAVSAAPTSAGPPTSPSAAKTGTFRFFDLSNIDVRDVPLLVALDDLQAQGYTVEKTYVANSTLIAEALARGFARFITFLGASKLDATAIREPLLRQRAGASTEAH